MTTDEWGFTVLGILLGWFLCEVKCLLCAIKILDKKASEEGKNVNP